MAMRSHVRAALAGFVLSALPAGGASALTCEAEVETVKVLLQGRGFSLIETGPLTTEGDSCTLAGAILAQPETVFAPIDEIRWTFTGFEGLDAEPPAAVRIDLSVMGARISSQTGEPWADWMLRERSRRDRTNISVNASWLPTEGVLAVERFEVDMQGANRVTVSTAVTGATLAAMFGGAPDLSVLRVTGLELVVENAGFLDGVFLGQIVGTLSAEPGEPDALISAMLAEMRDAVDSWPEPVFPETSRAALKRLIDDGPVPWGRLEIGLAEGTSFAMSNGLDGFAAGPAFSPEALAATFEGAVFEIDYKASTDAE